MRLYHLLYGEDGMSGLIGELRFEGVFNQEKAKTVKNKIETIMAYGKKTDTIPADDVASLCDMFVDLCSNMEENEEVERFFAECSDLVQELYND